MLFVDFKFFMFQLKKNKDVNVVYQHNYDHSWFVFTGSTYTQSEMQQIKAKIGKVAQISRLRVSFESCLSNRRCFLMFWGFLFLAVDHKQWNSHIQNQLGLVSSKIFLVLNHDTYNVESFMFWWNVLKSCTYTVDEMIWHFMKTASCPLVESFKTRYRWQPGKRIVDTDAATCRHF